MLQILGLKFVSIRTPLMLACTKDSKAVVDTLLHLGASLKVRNKDGWTPFHIACRYAKLFTSHVNTDSNIS